MLVAVDVELLTEVALVVEEADGEQRDAKTARAFDVVASEHAEAARIDRDRLMNAELRRKVDDRLRAEHARVHGAPTRLVGEVLLEPAVGLVDPAVEHQFRGAGLEPLGGELGQQGDRVVVELPPADRVELPKHVGDLGMPAPPEVAGQGRALGVEVLRREFVEPQRSRGDRSVRGDRGSAAGREFLSLAHGCCSKRGGGRWDTAPEASEV